MEEFFIPQGERETSRALTAKKDYLSMGPGRSLNKLLAIYRQRKEDGTGNPPTTLKATIARWSGTWGWVSLAEKYDAFTGDRLLEQQLEQKREEWRAMLRDYADHHSQLGKAGFKASAEALKELLVFLSQHPKIETWSEANQAGNLIRLVWPLSEMWAKSLGVGRLLNSMEENGGFHL